MGDDITVKDYFAFVFCIIAGFVGAVSAVVYLVFPIAFANYFFGISSVNLVILLVVQVVWIFVIAIPSFIFALSKEHLGLI